VFDGTCAVVGEIYAYTTKENTVVKIRITDGKIEKRMEFVSAVTCMHSVCGKLVIALANGMVYTYTEKNDIAECMMHENIVVKQMIEHNGYIAMGAADGMLAIVDIETKEIVMRKAMYAHITQMESRGTEEGAKKRAYGSGRYSLVIGDVLGNVTVLDTSTQKVSYRDRTHTGAVTYIETVDDTIYTGSADGCMIAHRNGQENKIREVGYAVAGGIYYNSEIVLAGNGKTVTHYSTEMKKTREYEIDMPALCSIRTEDSRVIVVTDEHDIGICRVEQGRIVVEKSIVGDNDEITDMLVADKYIVIGTNSTMLRVMEKTQMMQEGEYACMAQIVRAYNEKCSMALAGYGSTVYNGTKDGCIVGYRVAQSKEDDTNSKKECTVAQSTVLEQFVRIETHAAVTALHTYKNMVLAGHEDGIVKGWEIEKKKQCWCTQLQCQTQR